MKEMISSATKAAPSPYTPGTVTAYRTVPSPGAPRGTAGASATPLTPPRNCPVAYQNASHNSTFPNQKKATVIPGLKCAPDCLPHGDITIAIAVTPIADPMSTRRDTSPTIKCRSGDAGCRSNVANTQVKNIHRPSSPASIRYSG